MKSVWPYCYVAIAIVLASGGFNSVHAVSHDKTNVDATLIGVAFFGSLFGTLAIAPRERWRTLKRPSFLRFLNGGWQSDTLQCIRLTELSLGSMTFGGFWGLSSATDEQTRMFVLLGGAMFLGVVLGDCVIHYWLSRRSI